VPHRPRSPGGRLGRTGCTGSASLSIAFGKICINGGFNYGSRVEDAAADALAGHLEEEILDRLCAKRWEIG
jgi:hypothetical protein